LEGDCVGLTWPIPQAGLFRARLFFAAEPFARQPPFIARSVGDDVIGFIHAAAPIPLTGLAAAIIIRR
jgi:hypothetical protein